MNATAGTILGTVLTSIGVGVTSVVGIVIVTGMVAGVMASKRMKEEEGEIFENEAPWKKIQE